MTAPEPKIHIFEVVLSNYLGLLKSQFKSYPLISTVLDKRLTAASNALTRFIANNAKKSDDPDHKDAVSLEQRHYKPLIKLLEEIHHSKQAIDLTPKNIIVAFVSIYDAFIADIIRSIYKLKPELLNSSRRTLELADILKAASIDEIKSQIIEKEAETVLRENHLKQIEWLESKLSLKLTADKDLINKFIEITERRNLYVHANGKVSAQYLNQCTARDPELKIGDKLACEKEYVEFAYKTLFELGVKLCQVIWRKLDEADSLEAADDNLINTIYNLIKVGDYDLALTLSKFATSRDVKDFNKASEYVKIINYALSHYLNGDKATSDKMLEAYDWSACSPKYHAVCVITEKYDKACSLMREIGNDEEMKTAYQDWPLFLKIRETDGFKSTYDSIFNEDYECIEIKSINWDDITSEINTAHGDGSRLSDNDELPAAPEALTPTTAEKSDDSAR